MKSILKNITLIAIVILSISSCKLIDDQIGCSEFYIKNELSTPVFIRNYKFIDSGFYFTLDSALIGAGELKQTNHDCGVGNIFPYAKGAYTQFTFSNGKTKLDTFSSTGSIYLHDSINIYNKAYWVYDSDISQRFRKATYFITVKDSLEAR